MKEEIERGVSAPPKISVIVPVYNTEKYLHRCIDSILSQTFTDFELLLIDDGSKDKSGAICDEYAEKDSRVKVFHKENGGVSSARNAGLDNMRGGYLTFIDSDDWVDSSYLEDLIEYSCADLVVSDFVVEGESQWNEELPVGCWQGVELSKIVEEKVCWARFTAPWCKLLKKDLLGLLRFSTKLNTQEDALFMYGYLCKVEFVQIIPTQGYHYNRLESQTLSKSLKGNHVQMYDYIHLLERAITDLCSKFEVSRQKLIYLCMDGAMRKEQRFVMEEKISFWQIYRELSSQRDEALIRDYFQPRPEARRFNIFSCLFRCNCILLLSIYVYVLSRLKIIYF